MEKIVIKIEAIDSLSDLLSRCQSVNKSILIGNGFNLAIKSKDAGKEGLRELFNWSSLVKSSEIGANSFEFNLLKSSNHEFEKALDNIHRTKEVLNLIDNTDSKNIVTKLDSEYNSIRENFFKAILDKHPRTRTIFSDSYNIDPYVKILNEFDRIYSLNYDFLQYWVFLEKNIHKYRDGFKNYIWSEKNEHQTVFYLHGNFCFQADECALVKLKNTSKDYPVEVAYEEIRNSLVVSESTSEAKMSHISEEDKTGYLKFCYERLKGQTGILVTYGVSFNNDEHILSAILENRRLEGIYIGLYNYEETKMNLWLEWKINKLLEEKKILSCPDITFFETNSFKWSDTA